MKHSWISRIMALALVLILAAPCLVQAEEALMLSEPVEAPLTDGTEVALEPTDEIDAAEPIDDEIPVVAAEAPIAETEAALEAADEDTAAPEAVELPAAEDAVIVEEASDAEVMKLMAAETAPTPQKYTSPSPISGNTQSTLNVGDTLQLVMADTIKSYKSSNKKIATVSGSGLITAVKAGKATITATVSKKKKIKVKVTVVNPYAPTAVSIDMSQGSDFYLATGKTQLNAVLTPAYAKTTLKWKSSNKKVAKVSAKGVVTPCKAGTAKITVTTANKKKATVKIRVKKNFVDNINPKPTKASIAAIGSNWTLLPKSVQRTAAGKYVCKLYLINNLGKSKRIENLGLQLFVGENLVAHKTVSKLKIVCGKGKAKLFKLTFSGEDLDMTDALALPTYGADKIGFMLTTSPNLIYKK